MFVHRLGLEFCTKWCVQDVWSVLLVLQKGVCLIFSHQQKFVCDEVALEMIVLNSVSCLFSVCDIPSDPPSLCFVTEVEVWLFCVSVTWMNNDSLGFFLFFFCSSDKLSHLCKEWLCSMSQHRTFICSEWLGALLQRRGIKKCCLLGSLLCSGLFFSSLLLGQSLCISILTEEWDSTFVCMAVGSCAISVCGPNSLWLQP